MTTGNPTAPASANSIQRTIEALAARPSPPVMVKRRRPSW